MFLLPRGPGARRRRRTARRIVTATCAIALFGPGLPAPSHASGLPDASTLGVAAADETERFVRLWDTRFRSGPAFQAYLDSDQQYDDGFNSAKPEDKARLVRALVDHWRATLDGFEEYIDTTDPDDRDPDAETDDPGDPAKPSLGEILSLVHAIVFDKEEFKKSLLAEDIPASAEPAVDTSEGAGAPVAPVGPDPVTESIAELSRDAAANLAEAVARAADDVASGLPRKVENVAGDIPDNSAIRPSDITGVDLPPAKELVEDLFSSVVERPAAESPASVRTSLLSLTYRACARTGSNTPACQNNLVVEVLPTNTQIGLPGTTGQFDVDNNGSIDLEVGMSVNPLAAANALAATVVVRRLTAAATNHEGWVEYVLPDADKIATVGFDGRTAGLAPQTATTVTFHNLTGLASGIADIGAQITHNGGAAATVVLRSGYRSASTPAQQLAAVTRITRAPATTHVRYTSSRASSLSTHRAVLSHNGVTPDVETTIAGTLNGISTTAGLTLVHVPASVDVNLASNESSRSIAIDYTASATMSSASFGIAGPVPGTNRLRVAGASLQSVPGTMNVDLLDRAISYTASAASGPLSASYAEFAPGGMFLQVVRGGSATLSAAPSSFSVAMPSTGAPRVVFDTSANIGNLSVNIFDNPSYVSAQATVAGIPGHAELTLATSSSPSLTWSSSAPIASVSGSFRYGPWTGGLAITNVPTSFVLDGTSAGMSTSAATGTTVDAWVTNTGLRPGLFGDHAAVVQTRRSSPRTAYGSTITTDLAVSLHVSNIRAISVSTVNGTTSFAAQAGTGQPFSLWASLVDEPAGKSTSAIGYLSALPTSITGTFTNTTVSVSTNANPTLEIVYKHGTTAAFNSLATPTAVHGLIVRDGGTASASAFVARLYLPGLPDSLSMSPGNITVSNFRPAQPTLYADVDLTANPATAVRAYASIGGLPVGSGFDTNIIWSTTAPSGGATTTRLITWANAAIGPVVALYATPSYGARAAISNIPSWTNLEVAEIEGRTTTKWNSGGAINWIEVDGYLTTTGSTSLAARASLRLANIPARFDLTTGRDPGGAGKTLDYKSYDTSRRLNATVWADGRLKTSSLQISADLYFELVDLGHSVVGSGGGATMSLTSSPATTRILARVSATASYNRAGSGNWHLASWIRLPYDYNVSVTGRLDKLTVTLKRVSHITLTPGIATKITGDHESFSVQWANLRFGLTAKATLKLQFELWVCSCTFLVASLGWTTWTNVDLPFRLYEPAAHRVWSIAARILVCWGVTASVDLYPRPYATHWLGSGVVITGVPGTTTTRWATPSVVGAFITDVVTALSAGWISADAKTKNFCW